MKKWINWLMLVSILGNFASPLVATAVTQSGVTEETTVSSTVATSETTASTAIKEKTNETSTSSSNDEIINNKLRLIKETNFEKIENAKASDFKLAIVGEVTSTIANKEAVVFDLTDVFTLEDQKDETNILDENKNVIGTYEIVKLENTTEKNKAKMRVILNFNQLAKGKNYFKLILIGSITRAPNLEQTLDFYQGENKFFSLPLPLEEQTTTSTQKEKEEKDSGKKDTTKKANSSKKQTIAVPKAEVQKDSADLREPMNIDDLFTQYAPGENFISDLALAFDPDPPTINSNVAFHLEFAIPDDVRSELLPGDYYEMDIPTGLAVTGAALTGDLKDGNGYRYATYSIDPTTKKIRITFVNNDEGDFTPASAGELNANINFDKQVINRSGPNTIIFPSKTQIPPVDFVIHPTSGDSISKEGHSDNGHNPNQVIWTVDFNKDFSQLTNSVLTENFPDEVNFDPSMNGAVTIYPLNIDVNGNIIGTDPTPMDASEYSVAADGTITFHNSLNHAYRVTYITPIKDSKKPDNGGTLTLSNNVNLTSGGKDIKAKASVNLNYGKSLDKKYTGYNAINQEYSWSIQYNYGQKDLTGDNSVIEDAYSSNMDLVPDNFRVYAVSFDQSGKVIKGAPINPADYTIDTSKNPFTITFKNDVQKGQAINIDYQTKVNQIVNDNTIKVKNDVSGGNLPGVTGKVYTPSPQLVIKNKPTINQGNKMAHYKIDINKNKYQLDGAVFTDIMDKSKLGYVSVPVKKVNPKPEDSGVTIKDITNNKTLKGGFLLIDANKDILYSYPENLNDKSIDYIVQVNVSEDSAGYDDFTVELVNSYASTNAQLQMDYYIQYNQFSGGTQVPEKLTYNNEMRIDFKNNGTDYTSAGKTSFTTSTNEVNQGMKSGSYNPVTKEITWTIVTNYNNLSVSSISIQDPITGNQVYQPDSLSILRGTVDTKGNFQPVAANDPNYGGNQKDKDYIAVTNPVVTGEKEQGILTIDLGKDSNHYIPGWATDGAPMVFQIQFKTSLAGKIVYDQSTYTNTAQTIVTDGEQDLSASVSIAFGGQSALKNVSYDQSKNLINWNLIINPAQSLLKNVKVQDNPSSNQILAADSFTLYAGKYAGSGSNTTVVADTSQVVPKDQYDLSIVTDPANGQQSFQLDMSKIKEKPDPNNEGQYLTGIIEKPYVLTYSAEPNFATQSESVTNGAEITSEDGELPGPNAENTTVIKLQTSGGSAFGKKGQLNLQKTNDNGAVVPGAVLQLIRENVAKNEKDVLYEATTDSQGKVTFGNLIATSDNYKYYIKEIEAPDGYTISNQLLNGVEVTQNIDTTNSGKITILKNNLVPIIFNKTDDSNTLLSGGLFALFKNTGTATTPVFTMQKSFSASKNGVTLSGLSDGQYQIRETIAPDGYQMNLTPINFEVKLNDDNTRSVYIDGQKQPKGTLTLKNYQGSAVLQKTDADGANLAGAQFNVQQAALGSNEFSDFGNQSSYVTDNDGKLYLNNLPPGKYKVIESKAPNGYYLNTTEMDFVIQPVSQGDSAPETVALNAGESLINFKGQARFKKVDGHRYSAGENAPLAGAVFQLYDMTGNTPIGNTITSNTEGYFTFSNLAPGTTYSFKEVQAPNGYLLNDQVVRFTTPLTGASGNTVAINSQDQQLVVDEQTPFKNYKEHVRFKKVDVNNEPLGGAKYQLFNLQNDDWLLIDDIQYGAGEDGYFTSDQDTGIVSALNLSPGSYKFVEKIAPDNYLLNTLEIPFVVSLQAEGDPAILDIPITADANVNYQGSAQLFKEAEDANDNNFSPLSQAKFNVYTADNTLIQSNLTSNNDGNVIAAGLAPGDYYFKEVSVNGYVLNEETVPFTIPQSAKGSPDIVTTNQDTPPGGKLTLRNYLGAVEFYKTDSGGKALRGATFTIYQNSDEIRSTNSDFDGKVYFDKLAPGNYTIKETTAVDGYLLNNKEVEVVINATASGKPTPVTFDDFQNFQAKIEFVKVDEKEHTISGATFQLLNEEGNPIREASSDQQGMVVFENLAPGNYQIKEIGTSSEYVLNTAIVDVTVPAESEDKEVVIDAGQFINYKGAAEFKKTDSKGSPLENAVFEVFDSENEVVATTTSNAEGIVLAEGLAPGEYYFKEKTAPNGYLISGEKIDFTIPAQNEGKPESIQLPDVINYKGAIKLHKVGNTSEEDETIIPLEGANFNLYREDDFNTSIASATSDEDGLVEFKDLAPGTYHVQEVAAPNGYLLNPYPITFVIPAQAEAVKNLPKVDENQNTQKIDGDYYVLDAADFQNFTNNISLKKQNGESHVSFDFDEVAFSLYHYDEATGQEDLIDDNLSPNANGEFDLSKLNPGFYKLIETKTNPGFLLSSQPVYFTVTDTDEKTIGFTFNNYQAAITGKKIDGSTDNKDNGLSGAVYQVFEKSDTEFSNPLTTYDKNNHEQGTEIKTDATGEFYAKGLSAGDYVLKEVTAPKDYMLDTKTHDFTIHPQSGEPQVVDLGEYANYQGTVKLFKTAKPAAGISVGKALVDAIFNLEILDSETGNYQVAQTGLKTDENGELIVARLAPGDYQFVEQEAPNGYLINSQPIQFSINKTTAGKPEVVLANDGAAFLNYRGSASFVKTDVDRNPLKNAEFQVIKKGTDSETDLVVDTVISDENGRVFAENLAPGNYEFVEITAPVGYLINPTPIPFAIQASYTGEVPTVKVLADETFIDYQGSVLLTKESDKQKVLPEAAFALQDSAGNPIKDYEGNEIITQTDSDGKLAIHNLAPGKYQLVETKAPVGYLINTTPIPFEISNKAASEDEATVLANDGQAFINYKGSVRLRKTTPTSDSESPTTSIPLDGAVFGILDHEGKPLQDENGQEMKQVSKDGGLIEIADLAPGDYRLVEEQAPFDPLTGKPAYLINTTEIPFTIADFAAGEPDVVIANNGIDFNNFKGTVQLLKTNETGVSLSGAVFDLYQEDNILPIQSGIMTDGRGVMTIPGLAPGNYQLKEIQAPAGYLINTTPITFSVKNSAIGQPENVLANAGQPFINYRGSATLVKKDEMGKVLSGAIFELQDEQGNIVENLISDTKGIVSVENLAPGDYQLKETQAPAGYLVNTTPVLFTIPNENEGKPTTVMTDDNFINYQGAAYLQKVNEKNEPLEGVVFDLSEKDSDDVITSVTTDKEGRIEVKNLAPGDYQFTESKGLENYILNEKPIDFTISSNAAGKPEEVQAASAFINYQGRVELTKEDDSGEKLANAQFKLLNAKGNEIPLTEDTTDDTGKLMVEHLAPGDYQFIETKAPAGYLLNTTPIKFTIAAKGNYDPQKGPTPIQVTATNYQGTVKLLKLDAKGEKKLADAQFQLLDEQHQIVKTNLVTDNKGEIEVLNLAPGAYYFKEIKAPTGYILESSVVKFTIVDQAKGEPASVQVIVKNSPQKTPPGTHYPKTGDIVNYSLALIGIGLLGVAVGMFLKRKFHQS